MTGLLTLCGTPIGNLEDISLRVLRTLKEADLIAAEDTRHTLKLLNHFDIQTPLTSYHQHNAPQKGKALVERMLSGQHIALVTDAGMPGISDPGQELVALCLEQGIAVTAAPGPTAATTALALSGLDTSAFVFQGFLPQNNKARKSLLEELKTQPRTLVFYEAPHHLEKTVKDLYEAFGPRPVALVREMTKKFEEVLRLSLEEAVAYYAANAPKGEYVLVVAGKPKEEALAEKQQAFEGLSIAEHVQTLMDKAGMSEKEAMKAVAKERGVSKSVVYAAIKIND